MVSKTAPLGLIATTRSESTPPLVELVAHCNWPLVLNAKPQRLATELLLRNPKCLVFWLDDEQRITETARLVAWMRERGHRPYRVAIAYRLDANVEALFRTAGAHGFLPVTDQSTIIVANSVWSLTNDPARDPVAQAVNQAPLAASCEPATALHVLTEPLRPP